MAEWASYGFTKEGVLPLEEYYPNATEETSCIKPMEEIRNAYVSDAYKAILQAEASGNIVIRRCEEQTEQTRQWLKKVIPQEYAQAEGHPEYRWFLQSKFSFLNV